MVAKLWPGKPHPLGATPDAEGVNFAVYSSGAERIETVPVRPERPREGGAADPARRAHRSRVARLRAGGRPGALYGFRAHGPYEPDAGLRFNGAKLLVDPYARAITGEADFERPDLRPSGGRPERLALDDRDSARGDAEGGGAGGRLRLGGRRAAEHPAGTDRSSTRCT